MAGSSLLYSPRSCWQAFAQWVFIWPVFWKVKVLGWIE